MLIPLTDSTFYWRSLQIELKRHLNGYLVITDDGPVLIDPPAVSDVVLPEIEKFGKPIAILVTGRHQERRSKQYHQWYKAKLCVPKADKSMILQNADIYYENGDTLPGGFQVVELGNQRSAGESALYHAATKTLAAGHLLGEPEGYVGMQSSHVYHDFPAAFEAQLKLLEYDFEVLLPGRGRPLSKEGRICLARFLASFTSD